MTDITCDAEAAYITVDHKLLKKRNKSRKMRQFDRSYFARSVYGGAEGG
jgi:hypothetical protein